MHEFIKKKQRRRKLDTTDTLLIPEANDEHQIAIYMIPVF